MRGRLRGGVEGGLRRGGLAMVGRGGWSDLGSYGITRLRIPESARSRGRFPIVFDVDLDRITTACGFSYAPDGWHPYRATLAEVLAEPEIPYEHTTLARYYDRFQPETVHDAILGTGTEPIAPFSVWPPLNPLLRLPWALTRRRVERLLARPETGHRERQHLGPQTSEFGRVQVERLLAAHYGMNTIGYHPERFADGYLHGYFLIRGDDYRFVVLHGNHRLAAMERQGINRPTATILRGHPPVVDVDQLHPWVSGRYGIYSERACRRLFDALFDQTGRSRAADLGLLGRW